jgi:hypothetical protein
MVIGRCPECDAEVPVGASAVMDQRLCCSLCGAQLVVIGVSPVELDWAFVEPIPNRRWDEEQGVLPLGPTQTKG